MGRIKFFIPFFIFVVLGVLFWQVVEVDPTELPSSMVGRAVPTFSYGTVKNMDQIKTDADITGDSFSVINVWATWCGPCRQEHPYLIDLANRGVKVYGVNANDQLEPARKWLEQRGDPYQFSVFDPDGALAVDLGTTAYPETFLVDKEGVVLVARRGVVNASVWAEQFQPVIDELNK